MSIPNLKNSDLVENPSTRVPVVLCLDVSGSMVGKPIRELAKGVNLFYKSTHQDELARYSVEVAIVTFGRKVETIEEFGPLEKVLGPNPDEFEIPLIADGLTPMGKAIQQSLNLLKARKQQYKSNGVDYYKPWLILITDGESTDSINSVVDQVYSETEQKKLSFYPIAVGEEINLRTLSRFSKKVPLRLKKLQFKKLFEWFSLGMIQVSNSRPDENIKLDINLLKEVMDFDIERHLKSWEQI